MGLDMYLSYRRNLDGIPETIQRAMHKQAMRDAYPHVFSDEDLSDIVDKKIQNGEPYEEELLYLRNAHAIHEYLVKHLAGGIGNPPMHGIPTHWRGCFFSYICLEHLMMLR